MGNIFAHSRLIVSAGQGKRFLLIIGCHSELPSQGCTFCFLKHPLISPFCQSRRFAQTLFYCMVLCFASLPLLTTSKKKRYIYLKGTKREKVIDFFFLIEEYMVSCIRLQMASSSITPIIGLFLAAVSVISSHEIMMWTECKTLWNHSGRSAFISSGFSHNFSYFAVQIALL